MVVHTLFKFEEDIFYLSEYHPYHSSEIITDIDRKIMDLKNYDQEDWKVEKQEAAEDFFYKKLAYIINSNIDTHILKKLVVCRVPRSEKNTENHIFNIAQRLCSELRLIDGTKCLIRFTSIQPAHNSGIRTSGRHLKSIVVNNPDIIKNSYILLLDDVITEGKAFEECKSLLLNAGAKEVTCIAMGRTTYSSGE